MADPDRPDTRFAALGALAATHRLHIVLVALGLATAACAMQDGPEVAQTSAASTVGSHQYSGCSTAVVIGLSRQIAREANCEHPGNFVSFGTGNGIHFTSNAVLPYLAQSARDDLKKVAASHPLYINSGLRTLAQQYLLYRWWQEGRCGITAAAPVGTSNHEGGRAVDLSNWSTRISAMAAHGWRHDVPGDAVHFDHTASADHRGQDVHAFQVLWNRNHPGDKISTDGIYGPQTQARLEKSPSTGFANGPSCTQHAHVAEIVAADGPDVVPPQTQAHFTITIQNTSDSDWSAATQVELAAGEATSPLYDPSWLSDSVITTVEGPVAAGDLGTVDFDVTTPAVTEETPITETLQLDDGGVMLATVELSLTVEPNMTTPTSGDSGDTNDTGSDDTSQIEGGCAAGGGGPAALVPVVLALVEVARRRRRHR